MTKARPKGEKLTARERDLMRLLAILPPHEADGITLPQLAAALEYHANYDILWTIKGLKNARLVDKHGLGYQLTAEGWAIYYTLPGAQPHSHL